MARHIAKFHLDKLLDDGLLAVAFARAPGRRGPGAGRPAKLYSRSPRELAVSVPQRDYVLIARLLATAVTNAARGQTPLDDALAEVSCATGRGLGQQARAKAGEQPDPPSLMTAAADVLSECGYEPRREGSELTLVNCPFRTLAQEYTDLVCGINLALIEGLVDTLHHPTLEAHLEPAPGQCCVRLSEEPTTDPTANPITTKEH